MNLQTPPRDEETAFFFPNMKKKKYAWMPFSWEVFSYMLIFFSSMIVMELSLEAANTSFNDLDALAAAVTLFQFGYCFFLPMVVTRGKVIETFPSTLRELLPYVKLSLLVFGATALSTRSVRYVSYPTKVVFKSSKLIPTMIVATLLNKKSKYGTMDYLAASLLCMGAAGFSFASKNDSTDDKNDGYYGIMLLCISITCDALVPNLQQKLMSSDGEKEGLSAPAVMINVNAVGFVGVSLYMIANGSFMDALSAGKENPYLFVYLNIIGVGLSSAVLAYTRLIKASSSVVAVGVATIRKIFTVLLSYIVFPKPINFMHIISLLCVFGGILVSSFSRRK